MQAQINNRAVEYLLITVYTVAGAALLAVLALALYRTVNRGLSSSAIHQQTTRLSLASLIAMLPWAVVGFDVSLSPALWLIPLTVVAQAVTYPALTWLTERRTSPDIDNYMDIAMGLYLAGILSALYIVGGIVPTCVVSAIECVVIVLSVSQIVYYAMYHGGISSNGMRILRDTNVNEVIEFARYYPWYAVVGVLLLPVAVVVGVFWLNIAYAPGNVWPVWVLMLMAFYLICVCALAFVGGRSPLCRLGLVTLWREVSAFRLGKERYVRSVADRTAGLSLARGGTPIAEPHTILLVIGESATRDYMKAFRPELTCDATPALSHAAATDAGLVLFPNAYSCDMHTVQVLEKALSEASQYNGKSFADSCTIVDVARTLGYRIHWYSNQGHIGVNDTPVSLVAETSDVAKWTHQEVGKVQYDGQLLDFLGELDPSCNNLLVLHLKGSHFNFLNRYPAEATVWGTPGVEDTVLNYLNSLYYTDTVLAKAVAYCRERLNLQAYIYMSDHGTVPERHRSPNFNGYGNTRIPLAVWLSPQYREAHSGRFEALRANADRYWTNDLLYELFCGVLDVVPCSHYDPAASLADFRYRYTLADLRTFDGRLPISSDTEPLPVLSVL